MDGKRDNPGLGRTSRIVRGWRFDHNPVRRPSDRVETVVLTVLLLAFLAVAPLAALTGGAWAHAQAHRAELAQQASRRLVTASVLNPPPGSSAWGDLTAAQPARWTAPDGKVITALLPVPVGSLAGGTFRIWTTLDGQLTSHPLDDRTVTWLTLAGEAAGVISLAVALTVGGLLAHLSLYWRRLAAWDAEWRAAGPRWTTRA